MDRGTTKQTIRERVWSALDQAGAAAPPGAAGRIPPFVGAEQAAQRLATLEAWQAAQVIKANPDRAQLPVRETALREHKLLYMAVPQLAQPEPFYVLNPTEVDMEAARSKRAAHLAPTIGPDTMQPVDMVVCGTVAVDRRGARIGKGAGYADIEMGLLAEAGLIGPQTVIVTTVHELQVVDDDLPETGHDFRVDFVVTPEQVIECPPAARPQGILWQHLNPDKIAAIPALAARQPDSG